MTAATTTPVSPTPDPEAHRDRHFVLYDVDWRTYRLFAEALQGRHVRLTYDGKDLDLLTISPAHGNLSRLLGRFVFVLAEELDKPLRSFGDMTCENEAAERALEPDECFYIDHEPLIRGKTALSLSVDPPPDLAIEFDISRSSRSRLPVYAALGVVEVWQLDGTTLTVSCLSGDRYVPSERSRYFPSVPIDALVGFLDRREEMDEVALVREFRGWVRGLAEG